MSCGYLGWTHRATTPLRTLAGLKRLRSQVPRSTIATEFRNCPSKILDRSAIIEFDRLSFAPLVVAATPVHRARRPHLDAQDLGPATTGKPRLAATTHGLTSVGSKTPEADASRRIFWVRLRRVWSDWISALMIVKAETVVAWHRKGFGLFWTWRIHHGKSGWPRVPQEVCRARFDGDQRTTWSALSSGDGGSSK
jgi:hypothetical protein